MNATASLNIVQATIVCQRGRTDTIILETDLPNPVWPYEDNATVKLCTAEGAAEEYIREHFPGISVIKVTHS